MIDRRSAIHKVMVSAVMATGTFCALPAAAAETPKRFEELQACRAIADNAARLACFDRTAAALDTSIKSKELLVVEREDVRRNKRKAFGLALDEKSVFGDTGDPETTQITTKITSVREIGQFILIGVETGGLWQTTEYSPFTPAKGSEVTIKKGALGSFFIRFDRGVGIRGKRVQ